VAQTSRVRCNHSTIELDWAIAHKFTLLKNSNQNLQSKSNFTQNFQIKTHNLIESEFEVSKEQLSKLKDFQQYVSAQVMH